MIADVATAAVAVGSLVGMVTAGWRLISRQDDLLVADETLAHTFGFCRLRLRSDLVVVEVSDGCHEWKPGQSLLASSTDTAGVVDALEQLNSTPREFTLVDHAGAQQRVWITRPRPGGHLFAWSRRPDLT